MSLFPAFALATLASASMVEPASAPLDSPVDVAERQAIEALDRLGRGYFQMVENDEERAEVVAMMEQSLGEIGIRAEFGRCNWMGLVAVGTARGNRDYGAACEVRINGRPERPLLICSALYGGIALVAPDVYASHPAYIELFIRRACY